MLAQPSTPKSFCDWNRTVRYQSAVQHYASFPYAKALTGPTESVVSAHAEALRYGIHGGGEGGQGRSLSTATSTSYRSTQAPAPPAATQPPTNQWAPVASSRLVPPGPTASSLTYVVGAQQPRPQLSDPVLAAALSAARGATQFSPPLSQRAPTSGQQFSPPVTPQHPVQVRAQEAAIMNAPKVPYPEHRSMINGAQSPAPTMASSTADRTIILDIVLGGEAYGIPVAVGDDPAEVWRRFEQMRSDRLRAKGELNAPALTDRQRARLGGTIAKACEDQQTLAR